MKSIQKGPPEDDPDFADTAGPTEGTQSSLTTIFSIWNFMIGSAILVLAWDFKEGGLLVAFFITLLSCGISYYTTQLVMKQAANDNDYSDTLYRYFGKKGWYVAVFSNFLMLFAPLIIYLQYLAQMLYPLVLAIISWSNPHADPSLVTTGIHFEQWSIAYASLIAFVLMQLVMYQRDFSFFIKVTSFGSLFIIIIVLTLVGVGIYSLTNTNFVLSFNPSKQNVIIGDTRYIMMVNTKFSPLAGAYCTGFYMHQTAIPLLKNNKNQENNQRDMLIGFGLVLLSYLLVGTFGYFGFMGVHFKDI